MSADVMFGGVIGLSPARLLAPSAHTRQMLCLLTRWPRLKLALLITAIVPPTCPIVSTAHPSPPEVSASLSVLTAQVAQISRARRLA
jgi:hypothetical protein